MLDLTAFPLPSAADFAAQQSVQSPLALRTSTPLGPRNLDRHYAREELRHILLGSPEAIRQAIHQLHVLNYAESLLWSPVAAVKNSVIITPEQGAAVSLLKRFV